MNALNGPDSSAVTMARFLKRLDDEHAVSLPDDIRRSVRYTLDWAASVASAENYRRDREARVAREREAVLASDTPLPKGTLRRCEGKVMSGGGFHLRSCARNATHVRNNNSGGIFLCGSHRRDTSYGYPM